MEHLVESIRIYRELAKSGIVALVLISVLGGYLLGQPMEVPLSLSRMAITLVAILCLASGSSALNQIQDVELDRAMPRTAKRPLPSGKVSLREAWVFVILTVAAGLALLAWLSPALLALGVAALVSYNGLYTPWWKRRWPYAAIPGAIPGALPILMGYAAASGDAWAPGGIYLFLILFFWQMPHFWALALKYRDDYERGGIPTLPVTHGAEITTRRIALWSLCYLALATMAPLFLPVGWIYGVLAGLMSVTVLRELIRFTTSRDPKAWLRFFLWVNFSLIGYLAAAVLDVWHVLAIAPLTR